MSDETGITAGDSVTEPEAAEEPRRWYFTFGYGQRLQATSKSIPEPQGEGIPLDGCYTVIHGTFLGARKKMAELFGLIWCDQYEELPAVPGHRWKFLDLAELIGKDSDIIVCPFCGHTSEYLKAIIGKDDAT